MTKDQYHYRPIRPCAHGVDLAFARCARCSDPAFDAAQQPLIDARTSDPRHLTAFEREALARALKASQTEVEQPPSNPRSSNAEIEEAARFFARHSGHTEPDASDYRAVAKAYWWRIRDLEQAAADGDNDGRT